MIKEFLSELLSHFERMENMWAVVPETATSENKLATMQDAKEAAKEAVKELPVLNVISEDMEGKQTVYNLLTSAQTYPDELKIETV